MELKFLEIFDIRKERERFDVVFENVKRNAAAEGTNLWILFFAILIACLGLNVNSTAVVIGAMLISPLIGPIVGLGFAVAINDLSLIRIAFKSYVIATIIGLVASTIYFLITPVNTAHSEILARTTPSIYDVLIALFGGFAGVIAMCSKQKGNVLPGVAIATAIMPPLCTAGFGIATGQLSFFLGAFYLFLINSVFIFAATLVTTHFLKFPKKEYENEQIAKREKIITWAIIVITLIPSLYLGNTFVKKNRFNQKAENFIKNECIIKDDYLLNKEIKPEENTIILTYVGGSVDSIQVERMKSKLPTYSLINVKLIIKHGLTIEKDGRQMAELDQLQLALQNEANEKEKLLLKQDSVLNQQSFFQQVSSELTILATESKDVLMTTRMHPINEADTLKGTSYFVVLTTQKKMNKLENDKLTLWLQKRLNSSEVELVNHY